MGLDYGDRYLLRELNEKTVEELQRSNDLQEKLLKAFQEVASELRQVRQELAQPKSKPTQTLPDPGRH